VNEVSFRARPHHSMHRTLGVDAGATGPLSRVDSMEGRGVGLGGKRVEVTVTRIKGEVTVTRNN
jgi:hypothetical protein